MKKFKEWYEENKDGIVAVGLFAGFGIVAGFVGSKIGANHANMNLDIERTKLVDTLHEAKNTLNNLNSRIDSAVRTVYATEAKKAFECKLQDAVTNETITNMAKKAVEDRAIKAANSAAQEAIKNYDFDNVTKRYIEENSTYFDAKIVKCIRKIFDDEFADQIKDAVTEAVADAMND